MSSQVFSPNLDFPVVFQLMIFQKLIEEVHERQLVGVILFHCLDNTCLACWACLACSTCQKVDMFVEVGLFVESYNRGSALVEVADTFLDKVECLKRLKLVVSFTW